MQIAVGIVAHKKTTVQFFASDLIQNNPAQAQAEGLVDVRVVFFDEAHTFGQ